MIHKVAEISLATAVPARKSSLAQQQDCIHSTFIITTLTKSHSKFNMLLAMLQKVKYVRTSITVVTGFMGAVGEGREWRGTSVKRRRADFMEAREMRMLRHLYLQNSCYL